MEDYYQSWRRFHDGMLEQYNKWYALLGLLRAICYYIGGAAIIVLIFTLLIDAKQSALIAVCIIVMILAVLIILIAFAGRMLIGEKMRERIKALEARKTKKPQKKRKGL